jgi:hypothetical protein
MSGSTRSSTRAIEPALPQRLQSFATGAHLRDHHIAVADDLDDLLALQVVVLDQQQLLDRPRDELLGARQRLLQRHVIHRLFQHRERAHLQAALARILDRDDVESGYDAYRGCA